MRVVADTNILVSGFLWDGNERRLMDAARDGIVKLFTSLVMLEEFEGVLNLSKFSNRLAKKNFTSRFIVDNYVGLATIVATKPLDSATSRDADDDEVLACAISGGCEFVVTGDVDLLVLREYRGIRILKTAELLAELNL